MIRLDSRDIALSSDNPPAKEIISRMYEIARDYNKVSYDYTKAKPIYYGSKPIKKRHVSIDFVKYTYYISEAANCLLSPKSYLNDKKLIEELMRVDNEGCACIHCSVLLYLLLGELTGEDSYLVQGFYKYSLRDDFPSEVIPFGKLQVGFHAWLEYHGSVIDMCLYPQNKYLFNFKKSPSILGIIPGGMQLVGFRETKEVINAYAEDFASKAGMTVEEWLNFHREKAQELFNNHLLKGAV